MSKVRHNVALQTHPHTGPKAVRRGAAVSAMPGRAAQDAVLMARIAGALDKAALQDLAQHYAPRLKGFLLSRGEQSQTAEDIVQDVMVIVWTKAGQFDPARGTFSAWVYRLTRNKWIDHKRKYGRLQPTAPDVLSGMNTDTAEPADKEYDRNEAASAVRGALAVLPLEQKQMLHLAFFEGLSHSQISARTGVPLGTVKSRIRSSLSKMRGGLKPYRGVDER